MSGLVLKMFFRRLAIPDAIRRCDEPFGLHIASEAIVALENKSEKESPDETAASPNLLPQRMRSRLVRINMLFQRCSLGEFVTIPHSPFICPHRAGLVNLGAYDGD